MDSHEAPDVVTPAAEWPTPPPPRDEATNPFIGRFGLRAVWGILIFLALVIGVSFTLATATRLARGKSPFPKHTQAASTPSGAAKEPAKDVVSIGTIVGDGEGFISVMIVCFILSRIERRRIDVYGIGRSRLRDFLPGAFWGLALLSLLVWVLHACHALVFDGRVLAGHAIYIFGAKWLLAFLCVGLAEESINRGYLQYTLTRGFYTMAERISATHARPIAFWSAAVFMSCLFGAGHLLNPGESAAGITAVFIAGMVFSYTLWHTGSLWWAIGFHMAWDWAQSFLYGVPDSGTLSAGRLFNTHAVGNPLISGGATGPEGSIFVIPAFLAIVLVVRFTTRRGEQPDLYPIPKAESLPPEAPAVIA